MGGSQAILVNLGVGVGSGGKSLSGLSTRKGKLGCSHGACHGMGGGGETTQHKRHSSSPPSCAPLSHPNQHVAIQSGQQQQQS